VVSIKYAILILRADNRGEGGIVAIFRPSTALSTEIAGVTAPSP
jgi:K+ transporter